MEQTAIGQIAKAHQRIIYVEPNDVYDKEANNLQQGESLTPRYEDFCISFNLIIECYNRLDKTRMVTAPDVNGLTDENGKPRTYKITWGLTQDDLRRKRSSILQGNRGPDKMNNSDGTFNFSNSDYNYLTTYFTDISYDSYKKTEIEGLGVESVQISYESWYTPTVVIKFVDVRGSALWGREEAVHVDEKLTAENIFGAFFTMPYPLFRLQVKGFLGRPVTYQLTCSNFKGEFNAQTGNFEAVVTFIGYSWSLLTDIPFTYLVAAPYATYIGYDYWERKKNSKEWALWNGEDNTLPPPKLNVLFENIKAALKKEGLGAATEAQSSELRSMSDEKKLLLQIKEKMGDFIKSITKDVDNKFIKRSDITEKKTQLILFTNSNIITFSDDTKKLYKELKESLKQYELSNFNTKDITEKKTPNGWTEEELPTITFLEKFNVIVDTSGNITNISMKNLSDVTIEKIKEISFNEKEGKLTEDSAKFIIDGITGGDGRQMFKNFCYLIDFYDVSELADDRIKDMNDRENKIREEINKSINLNIVELLGGTNGGGFKPFIGNVFKVIFCHLETFCHIMFDSAKEIYDQVGSGGRTPTELGLDITASDSFERVDITPNQTKNIVPWPAIFDEAKNSSDCGYKGDIANVYGWVGDLSKHKFIEEKVVYALQEGIQMIVEQKTNDQSGENFIGFPILPSDFSINRNIFGIAPVGNISELSGYLALRITALFGVVCNNNIDNDLSKIIGRLDAYNLYTKLSSITAFNNIVKNLDANILEGIMLCKEEDKYNNYAATTQEDNKTKRSFSFETAKSIRKNKHGRHPFFTEEGFTDKFEYIHFYDKKGVCYVPTTLRDFTYYQKNQSSQGISDGTFIYDFSDSNDCCFKPNARENTNNILESYDWIYTTDSSNIDVLENNLEKYTNQYMFNIVSDVSSINTIKNKYNELSSGNLKVGDYEIKDNLTKFLEKFVKVGSEQVSKYFKNVQYMLSGNVETLQLDKEGLFGENMTKFNYSGWCDKTNNKVTVNDEGELLLNNEKTILSELTIQNFKIYYENKDNEYSLFGCPFYYLQNNIQDNDIKLKVKALLFLHTFKYNFNDTKLNIFSNDKKNGATEEVPKAYLLLLGGLLWRRRQTKEPIVFTGNKIKYSSCPQTHSLHTRSNGGKFFTVFKSNSQYNCPITDITGGIKDIDWNIENQLIQLFENFAKNEFNNIANKYELKNRRSDTKTGTKDTVEYTEEGFEADFKVYYEILTKQTKNGKPQTTKEFQDLIKGESGTSGVIGNYSCMSVDKGNENNYSVRLLLNENDKEYQDIFKNLYFGTYIITDSCYRRQGRNKNNKLNNVDVFYINKSLVKAYLNGFVDACKDITSNKTVNVGGEVNLNVSKDVYKNRDLSVAIYYYLKNLWDKWLVIATENEFNVETFFKNNFIFTDSFYQNVYNRLAVNCEKLLKNWIELADNGSLFHFLSAICTDHGCIFLPVPDYVGFNGETQKHDIEMMNDLFRPMPYNKIPSPSNSNKFVVMFTHSPSHIKDESNGYPTDSYDIWSHDINGITEVASKLFKTTNSRDFDATLDFATREGYNVPSFGIAFGRQNNHIFKNLKVTMDNPVMTEQAIKAQWQIALKGSSSANSVAFIGQDTFNVFTNYSYTINVEMIGNAQICPLMYFQLMNIPMWRGTYMIYKVTHNMTPGNMTTTITAMKMNKYATPFNTSFFTPLPIAQKSNESCGDSNSNTYVEGGSPSISGGIINNPVNISIEDNDAYNLVLWRYHKTSQTVEEHQVYEGVIYEYSTNKILTWTIEDVVDVNKNWDRNRSPEQQRKFTVCPGGQTWPSKGGYNKGCSSYVVSLAQGRGNFGKSAGAPLTMLAVKEAGSGGVCLFHPGKDDKWSEGCVLCGDKANNGRREFDTSEYYTNKIKTSTTPAVVWWRNLYDNVVPAICNGKKVYLYTIYKESGISTEKGKITGGNPSTIGLVNITTELKKAGFKNGSDFVIRPVYATSDNFIGKVVNGYKNNQNYLYCSEKSIAALKKAIPKFKEKGWTMCIFDAFRPRMAAQAFTDWAKRNAPNLLGKIIARGVSRHCYGEAIDLTALDSSGNYIKMVEKITTAHAKKYAGFDDFDKNGIYSTADNAKWTEDAYTLRKIMNNSGFTNTVKDEYWHFDFGKTSGNVPSDIY